jgi:O-antigen/teichoic acid export membrane protein
MIVPKPTDEAPRRRPSFARSAALTYGSQVTAASLSLLNVLLVARVLGPEGRGHVAFLTAIAWLSASLATLGVQEANANFAAAEPRTRRSLATNSVLLALALGGSMVGALVALIAIFPGVAGESDPALRWISFGFLPVIVLQLLLRFLIQADYGFGVVNAAFVLAPVLNVSVNGLFAVGGILSVRSAVGVWLAGQVLETLIFVWYVSRRLAGFGAPDLALARRALGFGAKAHAGRVMQLGNYRLDQWILGAIAGPRELGLYSVAVAWAEALWYLPTALSYVQRPDLVRATRREAARLTALVFRAAALVTAISALVVVAAAPVLCVGVFGSDFRGSIDDLRVLVWGAFGMVALKLFGNALVARSRPVLQSIAISAGFACTVALDVILIPPFGGLGAALASTIAYTAAGVLSGAIFLHALGGSPAELVPRAGDLTRLWRRVRALAPSQRGPRQPDQHAEAVGDMEGHEGGQDAGKQPPLLAPTTERSDAEDERAGYIDPDLERE